MVKGRFPTPHTVGVCTYSEGATDAHGRPTETWAEPVDHKVYGWYFVTTDEPQEATHEGQLVDVKVLVPLGFTCTPQDRIVVNSTSYDVIGEIEDYNHGPFGYRPGGVVKLRKVIG